MANYVKVASTGDIPPGEMLVAEVNGQEVAIANVGGNFYCFNNACSHRGGSLGEGLLDGEVVECPFHAGQFNVRTGEVVAAPPTEPVATYPVRVEGDDISVAVE